MAYMSQELKKEISARVKNVLPNGWKVSFKVVHSSTLIFTVREMPRADLVAMAYDTEEECHRYAKFHTYYKDECENLKNRMIWKEKALNVDGVYFSLNMYAGNASSSFENIVILDNQKEASKVIAEIMQELNFKNYDDSDVMTDYFNTGYYVNFYFGDHSKPCKLS